MILVDPADRKSKLLGQNFETRKKLLQGRYTTLTLLAVLTNRNGCFIKSSHVPPSNTRPDIFLCHNLPARHQPFSSLCNPLRPSWPVHSAQRYILLMHCEHRIIYHITINILLHYLQGVVGGKVHPSVLYIFLFSLWRGSWAGLTNVLFRCASISWGVWQNTRLLTWFFLNLPQAQIRLALQWFNFEVFFTYLFVRNIFCTFLF